MKPTAEVAQAVSLVEAVGKEHAVFGSSGPGGSDGAPYRNAQGLATLRHALHEGKVAESQEARASTVMAQASGGDLDVHREYLECEDQTGPSKSHCWGP